ncbi:MAG: formate dehydrogenase accessory sulfurtransferase FdhD [Microthrixaceae bacterium]
MSPGSSPHQVLRVSAGGTPGTSDPDLLAVEEPLEIRVEGRVLATTMRTPGNDVELAHGWLLSEGIVASPRDVATARFDLAGDVTNSLNVLEVALSPWVERPNPAAARLGTTTASCGICGTASIDAMAGTTAYPTADDPAVIGAQAVMRLPHELRGGQGLFERTGGTHGAGLAGVDGSILCVREDVGRHNAVDKVLGWALIDARVPLGGHVLVLSGRAGFELVQKAAMAGVPIVAAVGAPTALAVQLAEAVGITLVGFITGETANVYTRPDRVAADGPAAD